jgi:hypothetical protein
MYPKSIVANTRQWKDLVDGHNKYCQNGNTIPCNSCQNSDEILHRDSKNNPKIHLETQMTPNSQNKPE